MIRLNTTTRSLRAFLAGAITTNQLAVTVGYSDGTSAAYTGAAQLSLTNGVTPVTICAAPASGVVRHIDYIAVSNTDTAAATVTIQLNDNGTFYEQVKATLAAGRQLVYTHASGWNVGAVNATPVGANPSASVGLTAVNGTALTFMRSDAAPPLDQAIVPTWTGKHTWNFNASAPLAAKSTSSIQLAGANNTNMLVDLNVVGAEGGVYVSRANNTAAAPTALATDQNIYVVRTFGYGTTAYSAASRGTYAIRAAEAWTDTAQGSYHVWVATPTGGTGSMVVMNLRGQGQLELANKIYPGSDAGAVQTVCGIYAGTGAPSNANGNNGDIYIRSDGGVLTTIYQKRVGVWVGIV